MASVLCPDYEPAVRETFVWVVLAALISVAVALPFVLSGPFLLIMAWREPVGLGALAAGLTASFLGGAFLYGVFRCITLSAIRVLRSPAFPDQHWVALRRAFRWLLWTELGLVTAGSGLTAFAVLGQGPLAERAGPIAAILDAIIVYQLPLMAVMGPNAMIRHASVVPYFPRAVGDIETFASGYCLARHVAELDDVAASLGLTPLSAFGWNDDLDGDDVVWHDSAQGLKTVNALLVFLQREEADWDDRTGVVAEMKRLAHALERADAQEIPFSLLLRYATGTSGQEWEARKGTCF